MNEPELREALGLEHSLLRGPAHDGGGKVFQTPGACATCDLINAPAPDPAPVREALQPVPIACPHCGQSFPLPVMR